MKRHIFGSNKSYIRAQRKVVLIKLDKARQGKSRPCFVDSDVVSAIGEFHKTPIKFAICHGVRLGFELDMFRESFNDQGKWIGTEIVKELCDGENIIHQDFSVAKEEWIGKVDLIYTNSFDHARYPEETIKTWLSCLSPNGRAYIEWTRWHSKLGKRGNKADCFAADLEEYREMFEEAGEVEDVLMTSGRNQKGYAYIHHIFVVKSC